MHECRILWSRYELAMEQRGSAKSPAEQAAWWAEANEWLARFFDEVDREAERHVPQRTEEPKVLKPAPTRLISARGQQTLRRR